MEASRVGVGGHLSFKPPPPTTAEPAPRTSIGGMRLSRTAALDAYSRHKQFVNDYVRFYGRKDAQGAVAQPAVVVTDEDLLRKEHRFLRTAEDDGELTYEKRLAKKYYDKLFKEYAIADLRLYKEGKIGLRWRTEQEVIDGKGQFVCGARGCDTAAHLCSFEVHFAYVEAGEKKAALVKVRLCPPCGDKLHYKRNKERRKEERRAAKRAREADEPEPEAAQALPVEEGGAPKRAALETTPATADRTVTPDPAAAAAPSAASVAPAAAAVTHDDVAPDAAASAQEKESARRALAAKEAAVWQQRPTMERTKEDEFDEFFRDLFP